jgi:C1A family cysteine protease
MIKLPKRQIKRYGWKPDLPDQRDFRLGSMLPPHELEPFIDHRNECSPVEDQGDLGSCTANAIIGAMEFIEKRTDKTPTNLSRLFVYYNEREMEGTIEEDSGAYIRDGVKSVNKVGVCTERMLPYHTPDFTKKPSEHAYTNAALHKITKYERLEYLLEMKTVLAEGGVFVYGFTVYESFESDFTASTGVVKMPINEEAIGGHAVLAVGYVNNEVLPQHFPNIPSGSGGGYIITRNSWGKRWGLKGYFLMPYDYVASRDLSDDLWAIQA